MGKRGTRIDFRYNLRIYLQVLRPYLLISITLLAVLFFIEVFRVFEKYLFKVIVDKATDFSNGALDRSALVRVVAIVALAFAGSSFFQALAKWARVHLLNVLEGSLIRDLKMRMFNHIIGLSHRFYTTHKTGSLISRLVRGGGAVERLTDNVVFNIAPLVFQLFVAGSSLLYFSFWPALAALLTITIFVGYSVYIHNIEQPALINANFVEDSEKAQISDFFTNIDSVKYFGKEELIKGRFSKITQRTRNAMLRHWHYFRWMNSGQSFILGVGTLAVLYFPLNDFIGGKITIGTLVFIYTIYVNMLDPLYGFVHGIREYYRSMGDFESLFQYAKIENEIKDKPHAKPLQIMHGSVSFRHISFSYHHKKFFDDFSMEIKPHEKVALVGRSGSGKTTLLKLLYRLYDTDDGAILIDGTDIKDAQQESLRSGLSIVPQEAVLFDDTIYNNIAFSKPSATRSEVMRAMKFAQLDWIVRTFPKRENTIVGERGVKLSGGEKQRVSIARALLADKRILVLDEATSHLDSQTEHDIQKALHNLMKGRTSIIIAHRLSTIMNADRIVVLEKGRIIQQGTHRELIRRLGVYRKLWGLQKGGYIA